MQYIVDPFGKNTELIEKTPSTNATEHAKQTPIGYALGKSEARVPDSAGDNGPVVC
jgi:hypothetical protein